MESEQFFVGRHSHRKGIETYIKAKSANIICILGRRRVGKTYLIKEILKQAPHFYFTGIQDEGKERMLIEFNTKLNSLIKSDLPLKQPSDWYEAFNMLQQGMTEKFGKKKKVIFLDEFPWMDTHKSGFLSAFEYFWNNWAVNQNILVIICGSSTSWLIKNVMKNKGGLHNRVSEYFRIQPFTLKETEEYFQKKAIQLSRYDIAQLYMTLGGVPHYLNMVKRGESVPICIDRLFFEKEGQLRDEYKNLYRSLFKYYDKHELIVEQLAKKRKGLTREEIIAATGITNGGALTKLLNELEECNFISLQLPFNKSKKDGLYRLVDEYSMFYHHFITRSSSKGQFISMYATPKVKSWMGVSFENLCMKHEDEIKKALGISGVYTQTSSYLFKGKDDQPGFQIDMLLDRADQIVNLCEMKFYNSTLTLTQKDADIIRERKVKFQIQSKTKKNVMVLLITPFGITENAHSLSVIDQSISVDGLF